MIPAGRWGALLAWLVCVLAPSSSAVAQERVGELVAESRFVAALEEVARERDPLRRAQNELWVRHHAGDLHGALAVGVAELQAHPKDPFLIERSAFIAMSLRKTELGADLVRRLLQLTTSGELSAEDAARYVASVQTMDEELRAQVAAGEARRKALKLARVVVLSGLGSIALLVGLLAWMTGRPTS